MNAESEEDDQMVMTLAKQELRDMFDAVDDNGDGVIDRGELVKLLQDHLGLQPIRQHPALQGPSSSIDDEVDGLLQRLNNRENADSTEDDENEEPRELVLSYDQFERLMLEHYYHVDGQEDGGGDEKRMQRRQDDGMRRQVFAVFDQNGDGHIDREELRDVLLGLGENLADAELDSLFAWADSNGDGQIDYDEFCRLYDSSCKL
jgi:Ca2+-binding EF-hand superfamily protein